MKIEANKRYRTREGGVAIVESIDNVGTYQVFGRTDDSGAELWTLEGAYYSSGDESRLDLVEEIIDEQATTEASEGICVEVDPLLRLTASEAAVAEQVNRYSSATPRDIIAITAIEQAMRGLVGVEQEAVISWFRARYPEAPF